MPVPTYRTQGRRETEKNAPINTGQQQQQQQQQQSGHSRPHTPTRKHGASTGRMHLLILYPDSPTHKSNGKRRATWPANKLVERKISTGDSAGPLRHQDLPRFSTPSAQC